jgi:hypothetical protein
MIQFFATRRHGHLVHEFLDSWSPADRTLANRAAYEHFPFWKPLANGVCVFIDFERLVPAELFLAIKLAAAVRARPEHYTILNEPAHYPGRFNLQRKWRECGINDFNVYRVEELDERLRFPVFVRSDLDHNGPLTPLLRSRTELDAALKKLPRLTAFLRQRLMVVEYIDCADADGVFRKYSVMNIAGTLIPRHVLFSDKWATKKPDAVSQKTVTEEIEFTENFPHAAQVREAFRLAHLDYGRIDYGVKDGRIQVWEINTNPTIVPLRENIDPRRLPTQSRSAQKIVEALRELARRHPPGAARPFRPAKFLGLKTVQTFKNLRRNKRK